MGFYVLFLRLLLYRNKKVLYLEPKQLYRINMNDNIPKLDIPKEFIVGDNVTGEILKLYGRFPCKIKAGLFVFCLQGTLRATINLNEFSIGRHDFVTLPPGSFIQIHEVSEDTHLYFAGFSSSFVSNVNYIKSITSYLPIIIDNPITALSDDAASLYHQMYTLLIHASSVPSVCENKEILKSIFTIFLQGVVELYKNQTSYKITPLTRENEICREFVQLAMENYTEEHSVSFYAGKFNITLQHFCYTIKKASGRTALEIITSIIIMDAKTQLKSTDLPIKKIGFALGFDNMSFFNKYFRKHVGMTPQEYRES